VEKFKCIVTFTGGYQVLVEAEHVEGIRDYIDAWYHTDKTRFSSNDIRHIRPLHELEEPLPHVKHLKELKK